MVIINIECAQKIAVQVLALNFQLSFTFEPFLKL